MLNGLTISELVAKLAGGEISSRAATQACLDQVGRVDGRIRAFISYDAADALAQAGAADRALAAGQTHTQRPLLGVPIATKDVIAVKGQPLNCGSKILGHFISPYDATVLVTDGEATLVIGGKPVKVKTGEMVIMPANIPHSVQAETRFKMLLIMIREEVPA